MKCNGSAKKEIERGKQSLDGFTRILSALIVMHNYLRGARLARCYRETGRYTDLPGFKNFGRSNSQHFEKIKLSVFWRGIAAADCKNRKP
ncbi:MAG: hypothetical protein Q7U38_10935, partial [Methylobacter sp.]|nr:hypothetical protein [Methylobacter sp.]